MRKQNKDLLELDQFKNSLLKSIYHDLRFPVTSIKNLTKNIINIKGQATSEFISSKILEISNISSYLITLAETVLSIERAKKGDMVITVSEHQLFRAIEEANCTNQIH